ncbi:MAG: hypothetical protein WAV04_00150 [Candidatus Microsaccharimonas sp.]
MVKKQQMTSHPQTTALDRFALAFEYDKTIQEIKRDVRNRTI